MTIVYIVIGAAIGAPLRYLAGRFATDLFGSRFPAATFTVNITGCLLIGMLATLAIERDALSREARLLLITGLLGSYTTFSAFGLETYDLARNGDIVRALANAVASVVLGVLAVWVGAAIARAA